MSPNGIEELKAKREASRNRRVAPPPRHPKPAVSASGNDSAPDDAPAATSQVAEVSSITETPAASDSTGTTDGVTARSDAGISASENNGPRESSRRDSASGKPASGRQGRPPRRRGRPRGPERITLSVRITRELDDRLSLEINRSELGPQDIVEIALDEYLTRQQRRREKETGR